MILYNVTINIDQDVEQEWLQWMQDKHIPKVMQTGMFLDYKIYRLLNNVEDDTGVNYAIQYFCENMNKLKEYQTRHAAELQAETAKKYEGKFVAFRTLLEEVK